MSRTTEDNRAEIANIVALGHEHGCVDLAMRAIERNISRDQFAAELLERKRAENRSSPTVGVDLSEREHRNFKVQNFIMAMATGNFRNAGLELEASRTLAKAAGVDEGRYFLPLNVRASLTGNIAGTSSLGGAGVQTTVGPLIDLLRNETTVIRAGATQMFGLTSNVSLPRQTSANVLAWTGEDPSSPVSRTAATLDNVNLTPRTAMAATAYSRQLLVQASYDAANFVLQDLAMINAIGVDYAALMGLGSSNQPKGVRYQDGITLRTLGANGAALAWADIVNAETTISVANASGLGSIAWLMTPATRGKMKQTLANTISGASYLFDASNDTVNGFPALVTNNLPSNGTQGTSTTVTHTAMFGCWSQLIVATFGGGLELVVDPWSSASQNMVNVTSILLTDVAVKQPSSFVVIPDILVT